jgi:hypothetical protein
VFPLIPSTIDESTEFNTVAFELNAFGLNAVAFGSYLKNILNENLYSFY